jgi:hypothetical protein
MSTPQPTQQPTPQPKTRPTDPNVRVPRAVRKQVDDANKLLAELAAKPGEGQPVAEPAKEPAKEPVKAADPAVAAPAEPAKPAAPEATPAPTQAPTKPAEPTVAELTKQLEQANAKYATIKGKYDKEIPELRVALAEAQETNRQNSELLRQLADKNRETKPAADKKAGLPKPESFTKEELDEYGVEFMDIVGRRAREIAGAEVSQLKKQVEDLTSKLSRDARVDQERTRQSVLEALNEQVPEWINQNTDVKFLAWLDEADVFSGRKKRELLTEAFENNDAARVVRFFKAFQEDAAPAPAPVARTPSVDAGTLVAPGTPRNAGTTAAPGGEERVWTQQEIADFYAKSRRGFYKHNPVEKARIEREIVKAVSEGRLR